MEKLFISISCAAMGLLITISPSFAGTKGLNISGAAGFAHLFKGPVVGGKADVLNFSADVTWGIAKSEGIYETGLALDWRNVEIDGSGLVPYSNLWILARGTMKGEDGPLVHLKIDPFGYLILLSRDTPSEQLDYLKNIGIGIGLGYRFKMADFLYLNLMGEFQNFSITAFYPDFRFLRTTVWQATAGITLGF